MLKCFLGALFTYQLSYYAWLKLETMEEAHDMEVEMAGLQQELRDAVVVATATAAAAAVGPEREGGVGEVRDKSRVGEGVGRGGWWRPW